MKYTTFTHTEYEQTGFYRPEFLTKPNSGPRGTASFHLFYHECY